MDIVRFPRAQQAAAGLPDLDTLIRELDELDGIVEERPTRGDHRDWHSDDLDHVMVAPSPLLSRSPSCADLSEEVRPVCAIPKPCQMKFMRG